MKKLFFAYVLILFIGAVACQGGKREGPSTGSSTDSGGSAASSGVVLAKIGGQAITDEEVRKVAGAKLSQAEMELYDARKEGIDQIIEDRLLETEAKKQGVTKDELLKKNVFSKINISDREIEKFYKEKKSQMGGKSLDEMKLNVRGFIFREKHQKLYGELMRDLKKKTEVEILIKAPKVDVEVGDSPTIGPKGAPVKIVEFTDYQCPFCARARPTITQILGEYKGKVQYALRDFPLSFHKDAMKAHEAFHCAGEQGKYWEMNQKLWDNQKAIKVEDLKKYAQELRLKTDQFNQCLESGKFEERVKKSADYGAQLGVSGTPAFFVNGRMISGARPFEAFKEVIDAELESLD